MFSADSTATQGSGAQLVKQSNRCSENSSSCNVARNSREDRLGYLWKDRCYPFKGVLGGEDVPDETTKKFRDASNLASNK